MTPSVNSISVKKALRQKLYTLFRLLLVVAISMSTRCLDQPRVLSLHDPTVSGLNMQTARWIACPVMYLKAL